ncbi:MAG TPA: hypothetical protein VEB86_16130 [Chryseosolibacter sp.]|nr:hypothetical protein [Chryseosolibacter sp.]
MTEFQFKVDVENPVGIPIDAPVFVDTDATISQKEEIHFYARYPRLAETRHRLERLTES